MSLSRFNPLYALAGVIGLLLAIDIHECAHAWAANELGDPTARYQGRISLNPLVHLDPMGTLMILFSLFGGLGFGWGKPVPVNPWNLRHGRVGHGIVALAGPASNLILASILALPLRFGWVGAGLLEQMWIQIMGMSVSLALFNLLPIPPLDGASVLAGLLSATRQPWADEWARGLERVGRQAPMIFMFLILADQVLRGRILITLIEGPWLFIMNAMLGT